MMDTIQGFMRHGRLGDINRCSRMYADIGRIQVGPKVTNPEELEEMTTFKGGLKADTIKKMIERDGEEATALLIGRLVLSMLVENPVEESQN